MSKGSYTSDLEFEAHDAQRTPTKLFLVPVWLEDALEAHQLTKRALVDQEVIHSILTVDDINFYRKQVFGAVEKLRQYKILTEDITVSYLHKPQDQGIVDSDHSLYEENTSFTDVMAPFINKTVGCSVTGGEGFLPYNTYPSFEIYPELNLVCVTFNVADALEIKDLIVKEYEKYVSFLISQHGIKCVSTTETFKNVMNA